MVLTLTLFLLGAHVFKWEKVQVDWLALSLLGILLLTPHLDFIRRISLGEFEAEIDPREVERVGTEVAMELAHLPRRPRDDASMQLLLLARENPRLGLVLLRAELECVLRKLHRRHIPGEGHRPLTLRHLVDVLERENAVSPHIAKAVREILPLANRAVHGETIRLQDAWYLVWLGDRVLDELQATRRGQRKAQPAPPG